MGKNSTRNQMFYLPILNELKQSTNLSKIREKLNISKQQLNYYLRRFKKGGLITQKGRGWYEVVKQSKNSTKYGFLLKKDLIRGHAYIWEIKLPGKIKNWDKRIEVLEKKQINFKLVGAKKTTPRMKVLGRKVWLCNNHLRVFDRKEESYYGENAKESRYLALQEIKLITNVLSNKLGILLNPSDIYFQKEHYALIKNDLAVEENRRGNIWRIKDEEGEWLLIDDSLEKGGELENVGKSAFQTNIPMQKWWNNKKEHNFKITDDFILNTMNGIQQNQMQFAENMKSHIIAIKNLGVAVKGLSRTIKGLRKKNQDLKLELKNQKTIGDFF